MFQYLYQNHLSLNLPVNVFPMMTAEGINHKGSGAFSLQKECAQPSRARQFCNLVILRDNYTCYMPLIPAREGSCSCILVSCSLLNQTKNVLMLAYPVMKSLVTLGFHGNEVCLLM